MVIQTDIHVFVQLHYWQKKQVALVEVLVACGNWAAVN